MKKEIKLLDSVYSLIIERINNKESDKLYRMSQVHNILTQIDELQYNINNL